ncbi:TPA: hypothetical protein N0F65_003619 [Lagenidium giganteum]|uniref:Uncharacterized protein n=1 Tax=Lagenidium giganteum TaxID=4803 RepID=A0AAV2Z4G8_9STRA|nr:TPA: hypothetical protein N0F65_003619 [Lagenidium giganteum]
MAEDGARQASASAQAPARKKGFRFKPSHDVILVKEVMRLSPWSVKHGQTTQVWHATSVAVSEALHVIGAITDVLDGGACKRRFDTLLEAFRKAELVSLRTSGSEEAYAEREQLLTDIEPT